MKKLAWVIAPLSLIIVLAVANLYQEVTPISGYLGISRLDFFLSLALIFINSLLTGVVANSLVSGNKLNSGLIKAIAAVAYIANPLTLQLVFNLHLFLLLVSTALLIGALALSLKSNPVTKLALAFGVVLLLALVIYFLPVEFIKIGPWRQLGLANLNLFTQTSYQEFNELWAGAVSMVLMWVAAILAVVTSLLGFVFIELKTKLKLGLLLLVSAAIILTSIILGSNVLAQFLTMWLIIFVWIILTVAGVGLIYQSMRKVIFSETARVLIGVTAYLLITLLVILPVAGGRLVSNQFYTSITAERTQVLDYFNDQRVLYIGWDVSDNPLPGQQVPIQNLLKDRGVSSSLNINEVTSAEFLAGAIQASKASTIVVDFTKVSDYNYSIESDQNLSDVLLRSQGITFDPESNQWEGIDIYTVESQVVNGIKVDPVVKPSGVEIKIPEGWKPSSANMEVGAIQFTISTTGKSLEVTAKGSDLFSLSGFKVGTDAKPFAILAGTKVVGIFEWMSSSQTKLVSNLTLSDLEQIRVYQLNDTNTIKDLIKWEYVTNCRGAKLDQRRMEDMGYRFEHSDLFCIETAGPTVEASGSSLIVADTQFSTTGKVDFCTAVKDRPCQKLGFENKTGSSQFIVEFGESFPKLVTTIKVSPQAASRRVSLEITGGDITEYKLLQVASLRPKPNTENGTALKFKVGPKVARIVGVADCAGSLPATKTFDDKSIFTRDGFYTCQEVNLAKISYTGVVLINLPKQIGERSCLFNHRSETCSPITYFDSLDFGLAFVTEADYSLYLHQQMLFNNQSLFLKDLTISSINLAPFSYMLAWR